MVFTWCYWSYWNYLDRCFEAERRSAEVNEEELKTWMKSHRVFGQSESSWKLRLKALEELYPAWKEQLVLDPDMFATINSEEYNKVLCQPAHEFGADEQKVAVESVDSTLSRFYQQVYSFVHK
jgi:hypothetical protein